MKTIVTVAALKRGAITGKLCAAARLGNGFCIGKFLQFLRATRIIAKH
ncbi:MAG: hypothetical protein ACYDAI_01295 [Trichloromonadaceae bacterium]